MSEIWCRLEEGIHSKLTKDSGTVEDLNLKMKTAFHNTKYVASCGESNCILYAHNLQISSHDFIFKYPEFCGLTYFGIAHHSIMKGLLTCFPQHKQPQEEEQEGGPKYLRAYTVRTSNSIYVGLRRQYGLDEKRRTTRSDDSDEETFD